MSKRRISFEEYRNDSRLALQTDGRGNTYTTGPAIVVSPHISHGSLFQAVKRTSTLVGDGLCESKKELELLRRRRALLDLETNDEYEMDEALRAQQLREEEILKNHIRTPAKLLDIDAAKSFSADFAGHDDESVASPSATSDKVAKDSVAVLDTTTPAKTPIRDFAAEADEESKVYNELAAYGFGTTDGELWSNKDLSVKAPSNFETPQSIESPLTLGDERGLEAVLETNAAPGVVGDATPLTDAASYFDAVAYLNVVPHARAASDASSANTVVYVGAVTEASAVSKADTASDVETRPGNKEEAVHGPLPTPGESATDSGSNGSTTPRFTTPPPPRPLFDSGHDWSTILHASDAFYNSVSPLYLTAYELAWAPVSPSTQLLPEWEIFLAEQGLTQHPYMNRHGIPRPERMRVLDEPDDAPYDQWVSTLPGYCMDGYLWEERFPLEWRRYMKSCF